MNPRRWFQEHSLKLLAIRDTPEAIAGGVAIGIFFGFSPLFGLKTLLAIVFAWLSRSNILAAVIAATLHDLIFPLMPFIYIWEHHIGYWIVNGEWPKKEEHIRMTLHELRDWTTWLTIGKPLLIGSFMCGVPASVMAYVITKLTIIRHRRRKLATVLATAATSPDDREQGPQV